MKYIAILALSALFVGCPIAALTVDHPKVGEVTVEFDDDAGSPNGETGALPELSPAERRAFIEHVIDPSTAPIPAPHVPEPGELPWLCSIDGGRHCKGCDDPAGCPQDDSGPLCCVPGGPCVVWSGSHCSAVLGWCFNYTTETDPATGVQVATCHDQPPGA